MRIVSVVITFILLFPLAAYAAEETPTATLGAATSHTFDYIKENGLTFYQTRQQVAEAVDAGTLVQLNDTGIDGSYDVITKKGPQFVLPVVATFVQRLARQTTNAGCGKLIVTNGVDLRYPVLKTDRRSHHASGMVVDIAIPKSFGSKCHIWLERTLLGIESDSRVDISSERFEAASQNFPGYHVNVFVAEYETWLDENT